MQLQMNTAVLSWLQNDGSRGLSVDQLEGKQILLTFQPDALVFVTLALKMTGESSQNISESGFPLS